MYTAHVELSEVSDSRIISWFRFQQTDLTRAKVLRPAERVGQGGQVAPEPPTLWSLRL